MGERERKPFQLSFNGLLKVDLQGSRVTSDGGLLLVRELDERLGLGKLIDEHLTDSRQGSNKKFPFADLLRQSIYSRLAGYEDLNDAARVSADPTFRLIGSKKNWDRGGALTSRRQSFEIHAVLPATVTPTGSGAGRDLCHPRGRHGPWVQHRPAHHGAAHRHNQGIRLAGKPPFVELNKR